MRINVLNDTFTFVTAGKIQIDIRPFTAFFRKETFEQQVHSDRIDGRDPERITNRTVGGGTSALHQEALLSAVAYDVPHDKEVAFQLKAFDQGEFAFDLAMRALAEAPITTPVTVSFSFGGTFPQKGHHRLSIGNRVLRKLIA